MLELSLHILDLLENALRAGATAVRVTIEQDVAADCFLINVEDNGPGLAVPAEVAAEPFFTTKPGKRIGLGLSLLSAAAERAGGGLHVAASELGGATVTARLRLSHVDRQPLGDLAASLAAFVLCNPTVRLECRLRVGGRQSVVATPRASLGAGIRDLSGPELAGAVRREVKDAIAALGLVD